MSQLTRHDYASALSLIADLERAATDRGALLDRALECLPSFIACETAELRRHPPQDERGVLSVTLGHGSAEGPAILVLRRRKGAFTDRDRDRLALLVPHLAWLHAHAACRPPRADAWIAVSPAAWPQPVRTRCLTSREHDVMRWVTCGKTDADVAALLAISRRTVHKHLEHVYEKLGVETRTAAVMALARRSAGDLSVRGPSHGGTG